MARSTWGDEALSLLNATLKEVREKRDRYYALTKNGTDPKAMRSRDAKLLIREMHFARATIRGDRAGYEKATAELRATFQAIASFVLQAVLTAVLSPAAAALFRGISAAAAATRYGIWLKNTVVSMSSAIAANKAVYGNQYTKEMLYADLRGGLGGAIGSAAVGKLLDPIAGRLQARLGKEMAGEFNRGVKSYGGLQATAVLEGHGLVAFDEFAKQHFLGKVGERITHVTAKGLEHVGYGPGPTHAPYDPDAPPRPRTGAGGPETTGTESGAAKASADEPDVDVDNEPPARTPMALPPELDKPVPRGKVLTPEQAPSGKEHSQGAEEPRNRQGPLKRLGSRPTPTSTPMRPRSHPRWNVRCGRPRSGTRRWPAVPRGQARGARDLPADVRQGPRKGAQQDQRRPRRPQEGVTGSQGGCGTSREAAARLASTAGGRAGRRSAYRRWREAYNRYVKLPQETDACRRGMAMQSAVAEALLIPRIEAARQAARNATREQLNARRRGDREEASAALARHNQAVAESQALTAELDNLPHRTGPRTTLEQDLTFAREVRDQARREAETAQRVGDESARQEAIARYREAAQEIREIQQEIVNRANAR